MKKAAKKSSTAKSKVSSASSSRKTKTMDLYIGVNYESDYFNENRVFADDVVVSLLPLKLVNLSNEKAPRWETKDPRSVMFTEICKSAAKRFFGQLPPKGEQWNIKLRMEETPRVVTQDMLEHLTTKMRLVARRRQRR